MLSIPARRATCIEARDQEVLGNAFALFRFLGLGIEQPDDAVVPTCASRLLRWVLP